jgi:hypothetical protein
VYSEWLDLQFPNQGSCGFEKPVVEGFSEWGGSQARQGAGQAPGRPRIPPHKEAAIRRDLLAGRSLRSTIKAHGVGSKTVQRIKAELTDQTSA